MPALIRDPPARVCSPRACQRGETFPQWPSRCNPPAALPAVRSYGHFCTPQPCMRLRRSGQCNLMTIPRRGDPAVATGEISCINIDKPRGKRKFEAGQAKTGRTPWLQVPAASKAACECHLPAAVHRRTQTSPVGFSLLQPCNCMQRKCSIKNPWVLPSRDPFVSCLGQRPFYLASFLS